MDTAQDVKQALRLLLKNRGFAAATLVTIALGVGGTTAVFSVVYGVLLRPLPYAESERLVRLSEEHPGASAPIPGAVLTRQTYHAWSRSLATLEGIGSYRVREHLVTGTGPAQRVRGARVTPSLFRLLRTSPIVGRLFSDTDAEDGADPVVVLAYATWHDWLDGDPSALGRRVTLDDVDYRIVGIMPAGFEFPPRDRSRAGGLNSLAVYTPFAVPAVDPEANVVGMVTAVARLAPGVSTAQAEVEGTAYARSVERPFAELVFGEGGPVEVRVRSIVDQMTLEVRPALLLLAAGVGLVLLVATANVANLLLARHSARSREFAIRATLGAGRRRLLRQLLTESLVIASLGGILGVFVGWALTASVPTLAPADFPRVADIGLDLGFLFVAAGATLFVGTAAGTLPAARGSHLDLAQAMQAGGARSVGPSGTRLRQVLLVLEAALAVVLLVGAVLLARSLVALLDVNAGYDPANVLVADIHLSDQGENTHRTEQLAAAVVERLRAMPTVREAGAGNMIPFGNAIYSAGFDLPGMITAEGDTVVARALRNVVTPGYAEALGLRLTAGRFLVDEDVTSPLIAMVVNDTFAAAYFNDNRPVIGRRFTGMFPGMLGRDDAIVEVVGVVNDVLLRNLDGQAQPQIYVPLGSSGVSIRGATLVVKTDGDLASAASLVVGLVEELDPAAAVDRIGPLSARVSASADNPRFFMLVVGAFAVLALTLATVGLYGVLSYTFGQRRLEMGVRAALGATRGDLMRLVLWQGLTVTGIGLAIGVAAAAVLTRALSSILFGVGPLDGVAFVVGPSVLVAVAFAACLVVARRVASVNATEALAAD